MAFKQLGNACVKFVNFLHFLVKKSSYFKRFLYFCISNKI
ncbi:hypothetical protein HMPREF3226_01313 [Prevotella corporis]|uniref:Uncharacterized protein n=1 Tax=Prevotella corporis TaxID=28128 RepID=A0A133Q9A4_9BACT|nr:hypothetical protein HMPREF3226_01313 [Prevotella corporis]